MEGTTYRDMLIFDTWVMWDDKIDKVQMVKFTYAAPSMFTNHSLVSRMIKSSKTMLIEFNLIGYGTVYYVFDLKGSSAAIDNLLYNVKVYK